MQVRKEGKVEAVLIIKEGEMGNACRFFRLSLPGLKMEYKNQLSPFPLLHQPAKEFRGCSLEKSNFTFSIKRKNKQRK